MKPAYEELLQAVVEHDGSPIPVLVFPFQTDRGLQYSAESLRYGQSAAGADIDQAIDRLVGLVVTYLADCETEKVPQQEWQIKPTKKAVVAWERGKAYLPQAGQYARFFEVQKGRRPIFAAKQNQEDQVIN